MLSARRILIALPLLAACASVFTDNGDASAGGAAEGPPSSAGASGRAGGGEAGSVGSPPAPDAGKPDAGRPDTGRPDAGPSDAGQPDCRGPGRYEAGKEGSYRPCCGGLHEVSSGRYDPTQRACVQQPLNIYACVVGECGDGACELGEADPCGCPADCLPDASDDDDAGPPAQDPAWTTVTADCGFTFRAPPDLVETKVQGTDSCVVEYEADGCSYNGDYGWYSGAFDGASSEPGYRALSTNIDGQSATLVSYGPLAPPQPWVAGVHFPSLPAGIGDKLTFIATCETAAAQAVALQVFTTLQFDRSQSP